MVAWLVSAWARRSGSWTPQHDEAPVTHTITGACHHDCPDACAWTVTVEDGRAVQLRGVGDHPFTAGELCPKVNRLLERVYDPARLLHPLKRVGPKGTGEFVPISWDDAIAEIADRWRSIISDDGPAAILPYSFDGTQGIIQKGILARRFFAALGTSDIHRHLCGVTAWQGAAAVCGTPFGIDPEDLRHSRTILLWGTNTLITNRHLWPFIDEARAAGATVVVIDPVRTTTADRVDQFVQIRPGTDVALVLGLIHVLDRIGLLDAEWLASRTSGWDDLLGSAAPWTPASTESVTGVPAETVEWLATTFATRRPAAVRSLVGPEHREHGFEIMRAIAMLPAVTGAWRERGGGLARSTQVWWEEAFGLDDEELAAPARSFNMARLGEILTDESLAPPIRSLFVHNSNPAVIAPDQGRVIDGLSREDLFTVVSEQFMTDTARYADIVLPATSQIEQLELSPGWGHLYVSLNQPAIDPVGESRSNNDVIRAVATALELDDPSLQETDESLIRSLLDRDHRWLDGITWDRLVANGWARFTLPDHHLPHEATVFRLGPLEHVAVASVDPAGHPLQLISLKQHTKFLNTNYAQFERHRPTPPEPRLEIDPTDATDRGIETGTLVRVHNERGAITLTATVSSRLQPGLVSIPFGWWHQAVPEGRSVNVLTNPAVPDDDTGSAAFHDTWVEVTPLAPSP